MKYEMFENTVMETIKSYLPEEYQECSVTVRVVNKNHLKLHGLSISSPTGNPAAPIIYLEPFYGMLENGMPACDVLKDIARTRVENEGNVTQDFGKLTDFNYAKDRIIPKLVGMEDNEEFLRERPYQKFGDLAVVYQILIGETKNGERMTAPIMNEMLSFWKKTQEELHEKALKNMLKLTPSRFFSMFDALEMLIVEHPSLDILDIQDIQDLRNNTDKIMFVLTNKDKQNGATALLDKDMMERICKAIPEFYVIPSSIHEVIILKKMPNMTPANINALIQEINETQVSYEEQLSNHVYEYDIHSHEIFRV